MALSYSASPTSTSGSGPDSGSDFKCAGVSIQLHVQVFGNTFDCLYFILRLHPVLVTWASFEAIVHCIFPQDFQRISQDRKTSKSQWESAQQRNTVCPLHELTPSILDAIPGHPIRALSRQWWHVIANFLIHMAPALQDTQEDCHLCEILRKIEIISKPSAYRQDKVSTSILVWVWYLATFHE